MRGLTFYILCFWSVILYAQEKKDLYYTWINLSDGTTLLKGYLMDTRENHVLYLSHSTYKKQNVPNPQDFMKIPVENIDYFAFRKSGNENKYLLRGALIGAAAGGLMMQGADGGQFSFSFWEKFKVGAIIGAPIGILIGWIKGSAKQKIYILGNQKTYLKQREKILRSKIFR